MEKILFQVFKKVNKILQGKGLLKNLLIRRAFYFFYENTRPKNIVLLDINGYKMYVDPSDIGFGVKLLVRDSYEDYETKVFKSLVKVGSVVVDIGAHIGYYTLLSANLVGENGKIFSFEPEPYNFSLLEKNVNVNNYKNIVLIQKGVFNKNGKTNLFLDPKDSGAHSIYSKANDNRKYEKSIEIKLITLDKFFKGKENEIDVVKIDAEGAEPQIFEGMSHILRQNTKLVIFTEFHPSRMAMSRVTPQEFLGRIANLGFAVYNINEKKQRLDNVNDIMKFCRSQKSYTNLLLKRNNF